MSTIQESDDLEFTIGHGQFTEKFKQLLSITVLFIPILIQVLVSVLGIKNLRCPNKTLDKVGFTHSKLRKC